jgi:hypothetical protein
MSGAAAGNLGTRGGGGAMVNGGGDGEGEVTDCTACMLKTLCRWQLALPCRFWKLHEVALGFANIQNGRKHAIIRHGRHLYKGCI